MWKRANMKRKKKAHSKTFSLWREKEMPRVGWGEVVWRGVYIFLSLLLLFNA